MTITDEERAGIERIIGRWHKNAELHRMGGRHDQARQHCNWLFGLQVGLQALGLKDLALMADDAQNVDSYEE